MKTSLTRSLLAVLLIALVAVACNRKEQAAGEDGAATATIAPATPQPHATGTGDLTQTVDIEDSRSDAEGGVLTDPTAGPQPTETSSTTGTVAPPPTNTATAPTTTTR